MRAGEVDLALLVLTCKHFQLLCCDIARAPKDGVVDAAEVQPVKKIECLHSQLQVPALGIERNFSRKPQINTPEIGTDARISSCKYRPIGRGVTVSVDIRPSKQIERPRAVAFKNR